MTGTNDKVQYLKCLRNIAVLKEYDRKGIMRTTRCDRYKAMKGKIRDEKVDPIKTALSKESFFLPTWT